MTYHHPLSPDDADKGKRSVFSRSLNHSVNFIRQDKYCWNYVLHV